MKNLIDKYDDGQKQLLAQAQAFYNDTIIEIGRRIKPSIITPGQDVDSPNATMLRGAQAMTWWKGVIRKTILSSIPDAQDILIPPVFALVCGMVLGEICATNDEIGEQIPHDVEDTMADIFEGGYILGRVSLSQAIERGVASVEKAVDGSVKVSFGKRPH